MDGHYTRLIRAAMQQPWAITPAMAATITDILRFRAAGGRLTAEELQARIGAADDSGRGAVRRQGLVAVLPIYGVIANRTFEASSGMTSAETLGRALRTAVNDEEVSAILLDISSPGGTVDGVPELATEIFNARKVKPVVAIANAMAASAAYWLGSQADQLVVTPSGQVGSIGVFMLFEDWSEHLAKEGIKYEPISAGDNKLEGAFFAPMSEETRAHFQASVDTVYADFLKAVARGRNTTVADVKKNFGSGRVFDATDALARGMVDRVETFDQTVARLMKAPRRASGARAEAGEGPVVVSMVGPSEAAVPHAEVVEPSAPETAAVTPETSHPSETSAPAPVAQDQDAIDVVLALTEPAKDRG